MPTQVIQHPQGFLDGNGNYHVGACFTDMVYDKETKESLASILDEINQKIESGTGVGATVNWDDIQGKPDSFTHASHTHDDRYYTESEINTKLNGKANTSGSYPNLTVGNATNAENSTKWGGMLKYLDAEIGQQPAFLLGHNGATTSSVQPFNISQLSVNYAARAGSAMASNISMSYDGNLRISYS